MDIVDSNIVYFVRQNIKYNFDFVLFYVCTVEMHTLNITKQKLNSSHNILTLLHFIYYILLYYFAFNPLTPIWRKARY